VNLRDKGCGPCPRAAPECQMIAAVYGQVASPSEVKDLRQRLAELEEA